MQNQNLNIRFIIKEKELTLKEKLNLPSWWGKNAYYVSVEGDLPSEADNIFINKMYYANPSKAAAKACAALLGEYAKAEDSTITYSIE